MDKEPIQDTSAGRAPAYCARYKANSPLCAMYIHTDVAMESQTESQDERMDTGEGPVKNGGKQNQEKEGDEKVGGEEERGGEKDEGGKGDGKDKRGEGREEVEENQVKDYSYKYNRKNTK